MSLMSKALDALMSVFQEMISIKAGARNNAEDQKRIQTVHDMAAEMGVQRDCAKSAKAGARFSAEDMAMVEKIHDHAVNLGAECGPKDVSNYPEAKTSLDEYVNKVRKEFNEEFTITDSWNAKNPYCVDVLDDSVIGSFGDDYYKIPYSEVTDGEIEFESDRTKWVKVEKEWSEIKAAKERLAVKIAKREDVKPAAGKEKYGNVTFADATNKKYPIDTEEHIRAAWNYINKQKNADKYSSADLKKIKDKIVAAWKKVIDKDGPPAAKSTSIQDLVQDLREAFYAWWYEPEDDPMAQYPEEVAKAPWCPMVQDVLDDAIVINAGLKEFKIPYTVNGVDDYSFSTPDKWVQVEESWAEVGEDGALKADMMSANFGLAVKTKDNGHIGGYCVRFSDKDNLDATGEYFDKETQYDAKVGQVGAIYLHHTLPIKTGNGVQRVTEKIGEATITAIDDDGIELDGVLYDELVKSHDSYMTKLLKSVKKAVKAGKMGWSTGTASHLVVREMIGKASHIKRWPLGLDFTITPTPAGAMQGVTVAMKSFLMPEIELEPEDALEATVSGGASVKAEEGKTQSLTNTKEVLDMDPKELALALKTALAESKAEERAALKTAQAQKDAEDARKKEIDTAVAEALKAYGIRTVRPAVNAGAAKTGAPAIIEKTQLGDDAFKAFNYYLKCTDPREGHEALRDLDRERKDGDLLDPANFEGVKTAYSILGSTQFQGLELVPTEVYHKVIELRDAVSIARIGGATVIPMGAKTITVPVEKNRSGKFVIANEGSAYDTNAAQLFDKRSLTAFKFTRTVPIGLEGMEDSVVDLTSWWTRHVGRMEAKTENYYFLMGAAGGASTPEGIIAGGTLGVTTASGAAVTAPEAVANYYKIPQAYRDNVSFMCNGATEGVLRALVGSWFQLAPTPLGSGGGNFPMGSDWIVSPKCKLLVADDMADIGISAKSIICGNWSEYVIGERSAMSIFRDPYSSAASGLVNFHCHFRRGGMVGIAEAFQYLQGKSS